MHRCPVDTARIVAPGPLLLDRQEARHLRTVLRIREGEEVELFDGQGLTRRMRVGRLSRDGIVFEPIDPAPVAHPRPACALTLAACVCKGHRMDWIIEKAVELGASRILPVLSGRTVARPNPADFDARDGRWARIARESARQCASAWTPEILPPTPLMDAVAELRKNGAPLFAALLRPGTRPVREALDAMRSEAGTPAAPPMAGWISGPEGDFTPAEEDALIAAGATPVSLGPLILRAETAAIYGLCVLGAEWLRAAGPPEGAA
jgi:16S rRNA (uracil1498-N3)-methyltransferase